MRHSLIALLIATALVACSRSSPPESAAVTSAAADSGPSVYRRAADSPQRTDQDRERDQQRKPAEVLEFFGILPGMTVLDMFSGGGYYTELLSYVVGPDGSVVAHSNNAYAQFVGDEAKNRYEGNRLPNVSILMAENNELTLPAGEFDAVLLILSYHDIYFVSPDNGWPKIDGPKLLSELARGMKPGAVLGVVDHVAEAGSPRETGGTLHRIDPAIVVEEMEKAGFVPDGKSDALRNLDDDYSVAMMDPTVRGKTDRLVMRFRKR